MKRLVILIVIILILTACNAKDNKTDFVEIEKSELSRISPSPGGNITIPLINYESLNPLYPNNSSIYYFSQLVYDSLFIYNEEGQIEANLVEHYVLSPDQMTLTLTLKDNIFWHDGSKLTTQDVLDTFNFIKNSEPKSPYFQIFRISVGYANEFNPESFMQMELFDERNIDLHLDKPYAHCLSMLTFPILQSTKIDFIKNGGKFEMIGTGPYKLKEIRDGIHIELERNEKYHGKLPYISNIIAKIFDNEELASLAFETGKISISLSKDYDWAKYKSNPRIKIEEFASNEMDLIVFNNRRSIFTGEKGKKIKRAIAHSINKKRIIDRLFLGNAIETSIPLNINTTNYYGLRSDTYYNEDRAKDIIKEIGYVNLNNLGVLENEMGDTINLVLRTNHSNSYKRIAADFIVEDLRAIGINAYTNNPNYESFTKEQMEKEKLRFKEDLESSNFDIALVTVNLTDIVDMGALLHTNAIDSALNYGNYSNYRLDHILKELKMNNIYEDTKNNYISAIEIFSEDMPIVPLYIKSNALLIDESIQGEINPIQSNIYRNFKNVFILKQFQ